jgi:hypothetical protein
VLVGRALVLVRLPLILVAQRQLGFGSRDLCLLNCSELDCVPFPIVGLTNPDSKAFRALRTSFGKSGRRRELAADGASVFPTLLGFLDGDGSFADFPACRGQSLRGGAQLAGQLAVSSRRVLGSPVQQPCLELLIRGVAAVELGDLTLAFYVPLVDVLTRRSRSAVVVQRLVRRDGKTSGTSTPCSPNTSGTTTVDDRIGPASSAHPGRPTRWRT